MTGKRGTGHRADGGGEQDRSFTLLRRCRNAHRHHRNQPPDRLGVQHVRCRSPEEALLGGVWLPVTVAAAAERGSIVFRNINDTRCPG